jgi:stage II sporulation protein D
VRLIAQSDGRLLAVNVVGLEDYVASVIDSEMPATFPAAARRAQAVVARTYALARREAVGPAALFDVYASERSQKYLGSEYRDRSGRRLAGESASSRQAASDTKGTVLIYEGKVFTSYYSACCGGRTTAGTELFPDAVACHRSVACTDCQEAERYRWEARLSASDFRIAVNDLDRGRLGTIRRARMVTPPGQGVLSRIEVRDDRRAIELSGWELRQSAATGRLHSPHVSVALAGDQVLIEGRGHGHGVGLCQWGARGQALAGRDWKQIVKYYYPGAALQTLSP